MEIYMPKERLFLDAAKEGNVGALAHWLEQGVSIHTRDYQKRAALDLAVLNGQVPAVAFLAAHEEITLEEIAYARDMWEVYKANNKAINAAHDYERNTSFLDKVMDALFSFEGTSKRFDSIYESKKLLMMNDILMEEAEKRKRMPQRVVSHLSKVATSEAHIRS